MRHACHICSRVSFSIFVAQMKHLICIIYIYIYMGVATFTHSLATVSLALSLLRLQPPLRSQKTSRPPRGRRLKTTYNYTVRVRINLRNTPKCFFFHDEKKTFLCIQVSRDTLLGRRNKLLGLRKSNLHTYVRARTCRFYMLECTL